MSNPSQYFKENDLWDINRLRQHAEHNLVRVIQSAKFPNLVMLHYAEDAAWEKAWSTFARMCRGLIVDMDAQRVVAWPFEKFYNLGEMPETSYEALTTLGSFQTTEKLDGSMIICFPGPMNSVHFTTKGSFDSEHGAFAYSLAMQHGYDNEAFTRYSQQGTLMFELISKQFQIVVDYKKKGYEEGLYLIGYRDNRSNKLASIQALQGIAEELKVHAFKTYSFDTLDNLMENAKDLPVLDEGYVLRFDGDLLVKIKGTAYLKAHRFISQLSDKHLLEAAAEGISKEMIELAPEEYRQEVVDKIAYFQKRVSELENLCYTRYSGAPKDSRKEFALWVIANVEPYLKGFLFQLFDAKPFDRKQMYKVLGEIEHVDGKTRI